MAPRMELDAVRLKARYDLGETVAGIATSLGISVGPVRRCLNAAGVEWRTGVWQRKMSDSERVEALYNSGKTMKEIGGIFGVPERAVMHKLECVGVNRRSSNKKRTDLDIPAIIKLYHEGKSTVGIAAELGVSCQTINRRLQKAGVRVRTNSESQRVDSPYRTWTYCGYTRIYKPDHPRADKSGRVFEHIVVWEEANGPLPKGWHVHHIDEDKKNNELTNLAAMSHSEHSRVHHEINRNMRTRIRELEAENATLKADAEMRDRLDNIATLAEALYTSHP